MNTLLKITIASAVALAAAAPAHAGGLFGDGGLIRGSVGELLDEHIEGPITTPMARGWVNDQFGPIAGPMINDGFRRGRPGTRASRAQAQVEYGNICRTAYGDSFPGQWNPVGSACSVGQDRGYVIRYY